MHAVPRTHRLPDASTSWAETGVMQGALECPAEARPDQWQAFTVSCIEREAELTAAMDVYVAFLAALRSEEAAGGANSSAKLLLHPDHQPSLRCAHNAIALHMS